VIPPDGLGRPDERELLASWVKTSRSREWNIYFRFCPTNRRNRSEDTPGARPFADDWRRNLSDHSIVLSELRFTECCKDKASLTDGSFGSVSQSFNGMSFGKIDNRA
jgi:hypothetical protein